jgi:beta-xylosidase
VSLPAFSAVLMPSTVVPWFDGARPTNSATLVRGAMGVPMRRIWAADDGGHMWSPDVVFFNGMWAMWGAAYESSTSRMCRYRAVASTVGGPYTVDPDEPGLCTKTQGGSIDPQQIQDDKGAWWMLFKVDGNEIAEPTSIVTVKLDGAGHPIGEPKILISSDQPWEGGLIESPAIFTDTKRNQWWLSFSGGPFAGPNADYQIAATPCAGAAGPCLDSPGPLIQSNQQGKGPGEQGIFLDKNGTIWMSYGPWAPFFLGKPRPWTLVKTGFCSNGLLYVSTP